MLRFFSLIAALSISSIPLFAQHMNEKDSPCADVVVTVDLARCLSKARDLADAELNALYKRIQATLDATEIQGLITAERLWIQYRDANCIAERGLYGSGTASGPAHLASLEAMTRKRTKELAITYAVRLK
jgi:uncharacterized protein YecT (DUF1311 family)